MDKNVQGPALRTLLQMVLGFLAGEGLVAVWNAILINYQIDPTLTVILGILLGYVASWATNYAEAKGIEIPKVTALKPKAHD